MTTITNGYHDGSGPSSTSLCEEPIVTGKRVVSSSPRHRGKLTESSSALIGMNGFMAHSESVAKPTAAASRHERARPHCLASQDGKKVLGCGSNVVDHIYNVKAVPKPGHKSFFLSPFKALETRVVGGVTLNHLSWAALGGVPTGLLALQGKDELGQYLRSNLKKLGVSTEFIKAQSDYTTAQCHVFIQEGGERSIVMAPAATSLLDSKTVTDKFDEAIVKQASMVTTEISQVPLSGVMALLQSAKKAKVLSVLDLDIPPSAAVNEACLGSMEEVVDCVKNADILKPASEAAEELLQVMTGGSLEHVKRLPLTELAQRLVELCHSKLVAITDGSRGSVLATTEAVVEVSPPEVKVSVDATGAGDAYLGGLIVGLSHDGVPKSKEELSKLGRIANAFGATCVQSVGGVPVETSSELLNSYLTDVDFSCGHHFDSGADIPLKAFHESVRNDITAARGVTDNLNSKQLREYVRILDDCQGQILISGIGKSGLVGERFSSSLSSVGIISHYVHACEWVHGDLGKAVPGRDVVVFVSHSGNTSECVTAAAQLIKRGITTLALTGRQDCKLSKLCMLTLNYNSEGIKEPFGCLPTSSVVLQEMFFNAVLAELVARKRVSKEVFQLNHPGGSIGIKLSTSS